MSESELNIVTVAIIALALFKCRSTELCEDNSGWITTDKLLQAIQEQPL